MRTRGVALAVLLAGCSAADPTIGEVDEAVTVIPNTVAYAHTFDGIPAYALSVSGGKYACTSSGTTKCGSFNVYTNDGFNTSSTAQSGWFRTDGGWGYQCTEMAVRYLWARFGVSGWSFEVANEMCSAGHYPISGVTIVSRTARPVPGDLMVFGSRACGTIGDAGHVAVVDSVSADGNTIHTIQQNPAGKVDWAHSCALCFIHANANGGGTPPPPTTCPCYSGNGVYCGQMVENYRIANGCTLPFAINTGYLYSCQNGGWSQYQACSNGCSFNPSGADYCNQAEATCGCYSGNGAYCGFEVRSFGNGHACAEPSGMYDGYLYNCSNGSWSLNSACSNGCSFNPSGADFCTACPGPVCGGDCCPSGAWCGTNGRCCTGCAAGCPC